MSLLSALKLAQQLERRILLDQDAIAERCARGETDSPAHAWRRTVFGRQAEGAKRPYVNRDGDVRRANRGR